MYHFVVEKKIRRAFADLNAGRFEAIPTQFAAVHRHHMVGGHALGGERRDLAATVRWYGRLQRLLPGLHFEIDRVWVRGWPWRTWVAVGWRDSFRLPDGSLGSNQGVHEFELRWGRVSALTVHCDTARLAAYLALSATAGVAEAAAEPITA
jgi:hypothetical protein